MEKQFVSSSSIEALGYDESAQTLRVWFLTGKIYDYDNVPRAEYEAILSAPSIGAYFNHNIKGAYSYHQVR